MPNLEDSKNIIGKQFGKLIILNDFGRMDRRRWVEVQCECGVIKKCRWDCVKGGKITSCGCVGAELFLLNRKKATHNLRYHPLYSVWCGIKSRCYNEKNEDYKNYGGNGVIMCDEWLNDFKSFYDWAINNGYKKGLDIDKDKLAPTKPGKLYCPKYCCFLTRQENTHYKGNNNIIEYKGESMCVTQWGRKVNISFSAFKGRLNRGWSMERIMTTPTDLYRNRKKIA